MISLNNKWKRKNLFSLCLLHLHFPHQQGRKKKKRFPLVFFTSSAHIVRKFWWNCMNFDEIACFWWYPFRCLTWCRWWDADTVAVVTGANKGIGFAAAKLFAELGLTVVLTARDLERGSKAAESLREQFGLINVIFFPLDVSNPDSIKNFVSWLETSFGGLDILVSTDLSLTNLLFYLAL